MAVGYQPSAVSEEAWNENRSDPEAVRITILHVLGKMEPAEALPILREMAGDKSERVATEAKRYIGLLESKS